ncbi:MAG TPA: divalent metal cation transporter, partial [Planctomycetota bacterium]|nr:divalent metal cation transporter [Planctomycetota bacterium]
ASMVWAMPQYALATGVLQQNLLPGVLGAGGPLGDRGGKVLATAAIWALSVAVTWSYRRGGGVKLYERALKAMVAVIVGCFVLVVARVATSDPAFSLAEVARGFVPDLRRWNEPSPAFAPWLAGLDDAPRAWWTARIVAEQRDVILGAAATAVGINMTFLLPYSLLARRWTGAFSGLLRFDLIVGMLLPFSLTISCVVVAAASRFHAQPVPGLGADATVTAAPRMAAEHDRTLAARVAALGGEASSLPDAERALAAMLVKRDAQDLAQALAPMTGARFADLVFGLGTLGMALSTITLLMLISGFVVTEILGLPQGGRAHRWGTLLASTGVLGPFLWKEAAFYVAVPTSLFGIALLPVAYWTFLWLLNSVRVLGAGRPRGACGVERGAAAGCGARDRRERVEHLARRGMGRSRRGRRVPGRGRGDPAPRRDRVGCAGGDQRRARAARCTARDDVAAPARGQALDYGGGRMRRRTEARERVECRDAHVVGGGVGEEGAHARELVVRGHARSGEFLVRGLDQARASSVSSRRAATRAGTATSSGCGSARAAASR